ncbi:DUF1217 domain-containing protein [Mesobaculum littorinae]|nr:DUF1217 domain-containing protein [Mesobaculum littorinae]
MSFRPVVPLPGHAGWAFLKRTRPAQQEAFQQTGQVKRLSDHFTESISKVTSVEDLMSDRRLREVALGAFGLKDDIDSHYFVKQILSSNTREDGSLANKMSDKRYLAMARAFGFGDLGGPRTGDTGFARRILDQYHDREFEAAIGESDPNMRLVLGLNRDLGDVVKRSDNTNANWYAVMANPPLRQVFETALGLPKAFGTLDLDRQLSTFRDRAEAQFGVREIADFNNDEMQSKLVTRFLAMADLQAGTTRGMTGASIALTLLGG